MKKYLFLNVLLIVLLFNTKHSFAQFKNDSAIEINPFAERTASVFAVNEKIKNIKDVALINSIVKKNLSKTEDNVDFKNIFTKNSPNGIHYLFQQQYFGVDIYNAFVKINIDNNGKIISAFQSIYNTKNWKEIKVENDIKKLKNSDADHIFEKSFKTEIEILSKEIVLAIVNNKPTALWYYTIQNSVKHEAYLISEAANVVLKMNLNCNHRNTATAKAFVYKPDPLTSANKIYTPPFVHANNTTNTSLDSQRVFVDIEVTQEAGVYVLKNNYVAIQDFDEPSFEPATSTSNEFLFNRSESGFEDVNVVYHITEFQKYIQAIGFNNLSTYQIQVDAHALNGDDNSLFSSSTNPPRLFFGTGGVEDAEDADVIVHEYGHSLSYDANNSNVGSERRALDEGLCDYFATSYSRAIDTFRWADMFTWDGHNEFWNGRTAGTTKKYPVDLNNSIHANGEMWSSALMEIWGLIGRNTTDKLMLQTLYSLAPNTTLKDAANEFIKSDSLINNGINYCNLYAVFSKRGLIDSLNENYCAVLDTTIPVNAGEDIFICEGDSIKIGNNVPDSLIKYTWLPNENIANNNIANATVSPTKSTTYVLKITLPNGRYNTDSVSVNVKSCGIRILNSASFANGTGNLKIIIPKSINNASIQLVDIAGKTINSDKKMDNTNTYQLPDLDLSSGVYFIRVVTNNKSVFTSKIIKF